METIFKIMLFIKSLLVTLFFIIIFASVFYINYNMAQGSDVEFIKFLNYGACGVEILALVCLMVSIKVSIR